MRPAVVGNQEKVVNFPISMETDLIRKARDMHSNYLDDRIWFSCWVHVTIEGEGHQLGVRIPGRGEVYMFAIVLFARY